MAYLRRRGSSTVVPSALSLSISGMATSTAPASTRVLASPLRGLVIATGGTGLGLALLFAAIGAWHVAGIAAAGALAAAVIGVLHERVLSDRVVGHVVVGLHVILFATIALASGGLRAFSLSLFALVPLVALLAVGYRAAAGWTLAALFTVALLLGLETISLPANFGEPIPEVWEPLLTWVLLTFELCSVAALTAVLYAYFDGHRHALLDEREALLEERAHLEVRRDQLAEIAAERKTTNAQLKALDQEKSDFIGIAVHDLKSPLVSILGFAQMLRQDARTDRDREMSQYIEEASNRMLGLVSKLLDVNAIEQGRLGLETRSLDAVEFAERLAESYTSKAARKHQVLETDFSPAHVLACPERLHQVLDNLLSNAVKYAPHGSTIRLAVASRDAGAAGEAEGDGLAAARGTVRFEVSDEGPGFSDEDHARMFGKFSRLSARPTGDESSTGLGLYITKRLVEAMGGAVTVNSTYGEGASFVVHLPSAERAAVHADA